METCRFKTRIDDNHQVWMRLTLFSVLVLNAGDKVLLIFFQWSPFATVNILEEYLVLVRGIWKHHHSKQELFTKCRPEEPPEHVQYPPISCPWMKHDPSRIWIPSVQDLWQQELVVCLERKHARTVHCMLRNPFESFARATGNSGLVLPTGQEHSSSFDNLFLAMFLLWIGFFYILFFPILQVFDGLRCWYGWVETFCCV